jgi:hypothetical protein
MKTTAIHQHDDWFLIKIPGYGDVVNDKFEIEINLGNDTKNTNEYKKLRDEMIMERYYEKQKREIVSEPEIELVTLFDQKFGTSNILSMDDILTNL